MNILLAEDDPLDAALILRALQECGLTLKIVVVSNGEEALDYLHYRGKFSGRETGNPCAVLLDLKMPKVDGLQALRIIKSDAQLKTTPVVMLTSSCENSDLIDCYAQGVNAFVVKPVNFDEFLSVVRQLGVFWGRINESPAGAKKVNVPFHQENSNEQRKLHELRS